MSDEITIDDIMGGGGHAKRPDHPDFWMLSDIILKLKAEMAETAGNPVAQEKAWRAAYASLGDFDSIAYCAIQAAIQTAGYETGAEYLKALSNPAEHRAYVRSVQTYFDGFKMGAEFIRRKGAV